MQMASGGLHRQSEPESDEEEWFMKIRIVSLLALATLTLALAFVATTPAAPNHALPAAAAQPAAAAAPAAEPHPEIHEALAALRHAKEHMEHAAHDFGGHRVEALRATDDAIRQLEICLKFDK
jgi:hypothetical protein